MKYIAKLKYCRSKKEHEIICSTFGEAIEKCAEGVYNKAKIAIILKEGEGLNSGKFFLYQIIK